MDNDTYILIKRRINMNTTFTESTEDSRTAKRINELERNISLYKSELKRYQQEYQKLILQEIKKDMELEFNEWLDMPDIKEVMHGYIIKELNHYKINNKTILKLESKLIEFCIEMGVK